MAIGYTEIDFLNGSAPALNATNLNKMDEAIKDACDLLDAETTAGRAIVEAADAATQRSALGLGDSATKNVGTGAGDVAAGNAPAGAVTTHESTYAHANLPTADEKTRLGDIQAASGATTALKLANLATAATTSQKGTALLAADGGTTAGTVVQANDSRLAKAPVSWTPVPKFGGVNDDGTFAITANNSIQIGKFVHIEAVLTWTVKGTKTGTFTLTGAPVSGILPGTFKVIGSAYVSTGGLSIPSALQVAFDGGSFVLITQGATGSSTITDANFTATTQIRIVGDYIAA